MRLHLPRKIWRTWDAWTHRLPPSLAIALDLIREVHARKPGLPAILLTGHVGEVAAHAARRRRAEQFALLQKPMKPAQIAERLAGLMPNDAI